MRAMLGQKNRTRVHSISYPKRALNQPKISLGTSVHPALDERLIRELTTELPMGCHVCLVPIYIHTLELHLANSNMPQEAPHEHAGRAAVSTAHPEGRSIRLGEAFATNK